MINSYYPFSINPLFPRPQSYDFREKRWNKLPDAPSKRVFVGSALDPKAQRIYLVGGLKHPPTDGFSNEVQAFDVRYVNPAMFIPDFHVLRYSEY